MTPRVHSRSSAARLGALGLAATALLAGCAPEPVPHIARSSYSAGPSERLYDLRFQPSGADLAAGEALRMQQVLRSLELRQGDAIFVRLGVTGDAELDGARIATAAAAVGGTPARIQVLGSSASPLGGGRYDLALVQVVRNNRLVVICPTPAPDSWTPEEYYVDPPPGCVNALNRAHMAAPVSDLVAPRRLVGSDAVTSVAAVQRYEADRVKVNQKLNTTIGN